MPHLVNNVVKRAIMKPSILEKLQQLAERLEEVTGIPVGIVSIGPGREQTMLKVNLW